MKARRTKDYHSAILLSETNLVGIEELLGRIRERERATTEEEEAEDLRRHKYTPEKIEHAAKATAERRNRLTLAVTLRDGTTLYPENIAETLALGNRGHKRVIALEFSLSTPKIDVEVRFDTNHLASHSYMISADHDDLSLIERDLEEKLLGLRTSYSWIFKIPLPLLLPILFLVVMVSVWFISIVSGWETQWRVGLSGWTLLISLLVAIVSVFALINFYPRVVFLWNGGAARYNAAVGWRALIFGTILFSGLVVGLFRDWLSNNIFH